METSKNPFDETPIITVYTRADAIKDGLLIDVSEMARQVGITIPTAITSRVWSEIISPPKAIASLRSGLQSVLQSDNVLLLDDAWDEVVKFRETGRKRMKNVLWAHRTAVRNSTLAPLQASIEFQVVIKTDHEKDSVTLKSTTSCEPDFQPVLTIMFSNED